MGIEGMQRGRREGIESGLQRSALGDVIGQLQTETIEAGPDNLAERPRIYSIERTIKPSELEAMAMLDIECLLAETGEDLLLETGDTAKARSRLYDSRAVPSFAALDAAEVTDKRTYRSRFTLHNHPAMPFITTASQWVSIGDYENSPLKASEIDFIIVRDGVIGYKPQRDAHYLPWLRNGTKPEDQPKRFNAAMLKMVAQNTDRTLREQKEAGVLDFFVPFRGDKESERKLALMCEYMNNPDRQWESIKTEIEAE